MMFEEFLFKTDEFHSSNQHIDRIQILIRLLVGLALCSVSLDSSLIFGASDSANSLLLFSPRSLSTRFSLHKLQETNKMKKNGAGGVLFPRVIYFCFSCVIIFDIGNHICFSFKDIMLDEMMIENNLNSHPEVE